MAWKEGKTKQNKKMIPLYANAQAESLWLYQTTSPVLVLRGESVGEYKNKK